MFRIKSKTEKSLLMLTGILFLFLAFSIFSKEPSGVRVVASESSGGSEESTSSESEDSDTSEQSEDSEESEQSEESEKSEDSEKSTLWNKVFRTSSEKEMSEKSVQSDASEGELSEESVQSEESVKSEEFQIVATEGDRSIVKRNEKLFFLIPVEIESQIILDESGNVLDEKKSFFNWLLSVFSF